MSIVSTYYDALVARIEALLPAADGWTRIPNAYDLDLNHDNFLRQGWGVRIGAGSNNKNLACHASEDRTFDVVICRELFKTDSDAAGKADVDKQVLEDLWLVKKDFEENATLADGNGSCEWQGDDGVNSVITDSGRIFVASTLTFTTKVLEAI